MSRLVLVRNTVFHVEETARPRAADCSFHGLSPAAAVSELQRLTNARQEWTACDLCVEAMQVAIPRLIKRSKPQ